MKLLFYGVLWLLFFGSAVFCYHRFPVLRWEKLSPVRFAICTAVIDSIWTISVAQTYPPSVYAALLFVLCEGVFLMTITDLAQQMIYDMVVYPVILCGAISAFCNPDAGFISIYAVFCVLGGALWVLAKRTGHGIGIGDVKAIAGIVLYFSYAKVFQILFYALFCSLLAGIALMLFKKNTLHTEIPFLPFLFLGMFLGFLT